MNGYGNGYECAPSLRYPVQGSKRELKFSLLNMRSKNFSPLLPISFLKTEIFGIEFMFVNL